MNPVGKHKNRSVDAKYYLTFSSVYFIIVNVASGLDELPKCFYIGSIEHP